MAVGYNPSGSQNTEAYGAPRRSVYGQLMFLFAGRFIDQPTPIANFARPFGGNIGGFSTTSASVQALAALSDYSGDYPQSEQPGIPAPEPWERT